MVFDFSSSFTVSTRFSLPHSTVFSCLRRRLSVGEQVGDGRGTQCICLGGVHTLDCIVLYTLSNASPAYPHINKQHVRSHKRNLNLGDPSWQHLSPAKLQAVLSEFFTSYLPYFSNKMSISVQRDDMSYVREWCTIQQYNDVQKLNSFDVVDCFPNLTFPGSPCKAQWEMQCTLSHNRQKELLDSPFIILNGCPQRSRVACACSHTIILKSSQTIFLNRVPVIVIWDALCKIVAPPCDQYPIVPPLAIMTLSPLNDAHFSTLFHHLNVTVKTN